MGQLEEFMDSEYVDDLEELEIPEPKKKKGIIERLKNSKISRWIPKSKYFKQAKSTIFSIIKATLGFCLIFVFAIEMGGLIGTLGALLAGCYTVFHVAKAHQMIFDSEFPEQLKIFKSKTNKDTPKEEKKGKKERFLKSFVNKFSNHKTKKKRWKKENLPVPESEDFEDEFENEIEETKKQNRKEEKAQDIALEKEDFSNRKNGFKTRRPVMEKAVKGETMKTTGKRVPVDPEFCKYHLNPSQKIKSVDLSALYIEPGINVMPQHFIVNLKDLETQRYLENRIESITGCPAMSCNRMIDGEEKKVYMLIR